MALTPLERKAAFSYAAVMNETNKTAASESLGYSWTHVEAVMAGERVGSDEMKEKVATYCNATVDEFWGEPAEVARAS